MPVTYSFTTSLIVPTTTEWTCMEFEDSSMVNILLFSEVTASRASPWVYTDGGTQELIVTSSDGIASIVTISLPIQQTFTFETEFKPSQLPVNLDDLNASRFFIGVFDAQDNAGGVLISKGGLAIVASFGNSVLPIAGSQNIFTEGEDLYTLRMVVDGVNNLMDLYITKNDELTLTGHVLRYTTAAPVTPPSTGDTVRIEVIGQPAKNVVGKFSALKCNCSELLVPNKRPVADTGQDQTAVIGSVIQVDGLDSFDPENQPLTYKWAVLGVPVGSSYIIDGAGGSTVDDTDSDGTSR